MDCGADDTLCRILAWLFQDNEFFTGVMAKWLGETGILGAVSTFLRDHGEKLIGLAGVSFGFYRWWVYRERILHKRLGEYLRENDGRLLNGQGLVLQALQRPAPGQRFKLPLFSSRVLQSVLREKNWDRTPVAATILGSADWQLSSAVHSIERRIEIANQTLSSLHQQLATAKIIRGAVASVGTTRAIDGNAVAGSFAALNHFRSTLSIPGHENNLIALELEAHQLRKLQNYAQSLETYLKLEQLAPTAGDYRAQRLLVARSKLHQAQVRQALNSVVLSNGDRQYGGALLAFGLVNPNAAETALSIRRNFAPFSDWELLDEGHFEYFAAFVAHNLNFTIVRATRLDAAELAYETLLNSKIRLWNRRARRRLRQEARLGLERVKDARQTPPVFDSRWLCP